MEFNTPVDKLPTISVKRAAMLQKLGIFTAADMLEFFPRSYENRGDVKQLIDCHDGEVASVVVRVMSQPVEKYSKNGLNYVRVVMSDDSADIYVTFFNMKWIKSLLSKGRVFRLYGRITFGNYGREAVNPVLDAVTENGNLRGIIPQYRLTKGLNQNIMQRLVDTVLPLAEQINELLPQEFLDKNLLIPRGTAYYAIHRPPDIAMLAAAQRRLAFEELLLFQLKLRMSKKDTAVRRAYPLSLKNTGIRRFFGSLPYSLTSAQERVVKDIVNDIARETPMTRLIQGDVGSGKTVVAASAMYIAVKNGFQAAMMAPTEILAVQHYNTLSKLFEGFDISICLLSGGLTATQKKHVRAEIAEGLHDIIIGTNAIIQSGVEFKNLALTVTDEQHRFGVLQRATLANKGGEGFSPHTLIMSATPIPRTLSMIMYGDLDISVIDELPPGRQYIETRAYGDESRPKVYEFIRRQLLAGRQVYIVCPLVEESESVDLKAAEEHEKNIKALFPHYTCGMLHGRMPAKKKAEIMQEFKEGRLSLLISTTVVEVGVDVPNATVMMVENAERFGLSTLHQLRGRVGRGMAKSFCILMYDKKSDKAAERLDVMCQTNNGFEIAETDLKLRGPGDFFGERQSGEMRFKIANMADMQLVTQTRYAADDILENLENPEFSTIVEFVRHQLDDALAKNILS